MPDDVLLNKVAAIERAVARVREEYGGEDTNLFDNLTRQDAILLNLQRACESAIDLAMHLVRTERLGVPQESRDAFGLLAGGGVVDADLAERLQKMVGFRNIAVHDYERLNLQIVRAIVTERLHDFEQFCERALQRLQIAALQPSLRPRHVHPSHTAAADHPAANGTSAPVPNDD